MKRRHQCPWEETKCLPCLFYDSGISSCINCSNCGCFKGQVGTNIDRTLFLQNMCSCILRTIYAERLRLANEELSLPVFAPKKNDRFLVIIHRTCTLGIQVLPVIKNKTMMMGGGLAIFQKLIELRPSFEIISETC